jgi:hypothetical protein
MRITPRRVLIALPLIGLSVPVLFFSFLYLLGMSMVDRPAPSSADVPPVLAEAIWAFAGGGRETEMRPLNPIGMFRSVTCIEEAQHQEDPQVTDAQLTACRRHLPGLQLMEHLANQHVRDQQIERNSFTGGAASFSTMIRLSGAWSKAEFVRTVAERAQYGKGLRGVGSASIAFFGRQPEALTLAQAAWVAARAGVDRPDPWCEPDAALKVRNRVLAGMLVNGVITQGDFKDASNTPLAPAPAPPDHKRCGD